MNFNQLPEEMLELIASHASQRALWALSLTSRRLNRVTVQYLYRNPIIKGSYAWEQFADLIAESQELGAMVQGLKLTPTKRENLAAEIRRIKKGRKISNSLEEVDKVCAPTIIRHDRDLEEMLRLAANFTNLTQVSMRLEFKLAPICLPAVLRIRNLKHLALTCQDRAPIMNRQWMEMLAHNSLCLETSVLSKHLSTHNFYFPYLLAAIKDVRRLCIVGVDLRSTADAIRDIAHDINDGRSFDEICYYIKPGPQWNITRFWSRTGFRNIEARYVSISSHNFDGRPRPWRWIPEFTEHLTIHDMSWRQMVKAFTGMRRADLPRLKSITLDHELPTQEAIGKWRAQTRLPRDFEFRYTSQKVKLGVRKDFGFRDPSDIPL